MAGVDLGDDEGDVGGHAEGGGVGDDGASGGGESGLELVGDRCVEGGEDDAWEFGLPIECRGALGGVGGEGHGGDCRGERGVELPAAGFVVTLALRAVAGGEPGDLKPGVLGEKLDEALADHAGGPEYAYFAAFHI